MTSKTKKTTTTKRKRKSKSGIRRPRYNLRRLLLGTILVIALLVGGYFINTSHKKIFFEIEEFIARSVGAKVKKILVSGVKHTDGEFLYSQIGLEKGASLVGFDAYQVRKNIEILPWVKLAVVERKLPSTVKIEIFEHAPLARLETDEDGLWVINRDGQKIVSAEEGFEDLLVIGGLGAETQLNQIFTLVVDSFSEYKYIVRLDFIGKRRWNVTFKNDVIVQLSEKNPEQSLRKISQLEAKYNILSKKGWLIDLRLEDKIVFRVPGKGNVSL